MKMKRRERKREPDVCIHKKLFVGFMYFFLHSFETRSEKEIERQKDRFRFYVFFLSIGRQFTVVTSLLLPMLLLVLYCILYSLSRVLLFEKLNYVCTYHIIVSVLLLILYPRKEYNYYVVGNPHKFVDYFRLHAVRYIITIYCTHRRNKLSN